MTPQPNPFDGAKPVGGDRLARPKPSADDVRLIRRYADVHAFGVGDITLDEDGDARGAIAGRWVVVADDHEGEGLFPGAEGVLYIGTVGAPQYGNHRAALFFLEDDTECAVQLSDRGVVERIEP